VMGVRFVLVGSGKMAADVLGLVAREPGAEPVLCVGDARREVAQSRLEQAAGAAGVPYLDAPNLNDPTILAAMRAARPTYIVSVNNFRILGEDCLAIPQRGAINFHDGPLPRYGGVHPCSWAILRGEETHGVTWHVVERGLDTGPILAQSHFPIRRGERVISLISRCIHEGTRLFEALLPALVADEARPVPQQGEPLYFGRHDLPWEGSLPWWESRDVLGRLSRAIGFHPFPNTFYRPRLRVDGFPDLYASGFELIAGAGPRGTVIAGGAEPIIATPDAAIRLDEIEDEPGHPIEDPAAWGMRPGACLCGPSGDAAGILAAGSRSSSSIRGGVLSSATL
jgi:methionyl-tRNA formyltransferase